MIAVAILAAAIVSSLTVDIGPVARPAAERYLSDQMQRPVHIGGMTVNVLSGLLLGRVELEDFTIEGRAPSDRPFFTAERLQVSIDWWPALARQPNITVTSVQLDDWQMLVEKWPDGDSFPRFKRSNRPRNVPGRLQPPSRDFRGSDGQFKYEDHETPWSVLAPKIDLRIGNLPKYNGRRRLEGWNDRHPELCADVVEPEASGSSSMAICLHLTHVEIETDGAKSAASGDLDMAHWPEQTYNVKSHVQFQRMRELFFANEDWPLTGEADFTGVFHLFKGGHDLTGRFASDVAGVYDYRFPSLYGSLHWNKHLFDVWDAGSRFSGGDATFTFSIKPLGSRVRPTARFEASYTNVDLAEFTDFQQLTGLRFAGTRGRPQRARMAARRDRRAAWRWARSRSRRRQASSSMTESLAAARAADPGARAA